MSNFTTEVRYICESVVNKTESVGYSGVEEVIQQAAPKIFDFKFPIFDEDYRLPLETKILRHYYTREIGYETVGLWKLKLATKMNEIMPYYNQLYESELLQFNPLYDTDLTTTGNRQGAGKDTIARDKNGTIGKTGEGSSHTKNLSGSTEDDTRTIDTNEQHRDTRSIDTKKEITDTRDITVNETNSNDRTTHNTNRFSDTPQGDLIGMSRVEDNLWLTTATIDNGSINDAGKRDTVTKDVDKINEIDSVTDKNEGESVQGGTITDHKHIDTGGDTWVGKENKEDTTINETNNETKNSTTTDEYTEKVIGKRGAHTYAQLVKEFRANFLNIDLLVISELEPLFFGLWE